MMAAQSNIGGVLCESSIPCTTPQSLAAAVPCINAASIRERKTWTQSEFCTWQNSVRGQESLYIVCQPRRRQMSCKVSLSDVAAVTIKAKTRNRLKFSVVPQTRESISAASAPMFTILWGHVPFNKFFQIVDTCLSCEDTARQICAMVCSWRFLRHFCVLYFQRAACTTFQTCILNSH